MPLSDLLKNNLSWAAKQKASDPAFFERLCAIQRPDYLWIGCSDSRVPANEIVGLAPGELFVHRNVANVVRPGDANCLSVLQYSVDVLKVSQIIVCGHYRCGGVQAVFGPPATEPLEGWLTPIRAIREKHSEELAGLGDDEARWHRLCELNVIEHVRILSKLDTLIEAWKRGQKVAVHGWIYDLSDGLLRDLKVSIDSPSM